MAKLDVKALDELIKEVFSIQIKKPKGVPVKDGEKIEKYNFDKEVSDEHVNIDDFPELEYDKYPVYSDDSKKNDAEMSNPRKSAAIRQAKKNLYNQLGILDKFAATKLPNYDQMVAALDDANPKDVINKADLELSLTSQKEKDDDGNVTRTYQALPKGGPNQASNKIKLLFLFIAAENGHKDIQDYLESDEINIPENYTQMAMARRAQFIDNADPFKDGGWVDTYLKALAPSPDDLPEPKITPMDPSERGSFADQSMVTGPIESGQMLASQYYMFEAFREKNLSESIEKLSEFSNLVANRGSGAFAAQNDSLDGILGFLNSALILDYFNTFAKEIDHGAGAYFFEAFLAYLSGGTTAGKMSGAGGGMGEVDFVLGSGKRGSAKYMQAGANPTQATKNFTQNAPVEYIVAAKKDEKGSKTSDINKIYTIDIYVMNVTMRDYVLDKKGKQVEPSGGNMGFEITDMDDNLLDFPEARYSAGSKVEIGTAIRNSTPFTLTFVSTSGDLLRDNLLATSKKIGGVIEKATEMFDGLMQSLAKTKDMSIRFASDGDIDTGKQAVDAVKAAKGAPKQGGNAGSGLEGLIELFTEKGAIDSSQQQVSESKIAQLDKLILEVLKNNH